MAFAIVGAGMSKFGMFRDKNSKDLFAEAFGEMLTSVDKGIDPNDIDALYLGNFSNDFFVHTRPTGGPIVSDLIGLTPKPATRTEGACASSALAFREGVFAIASGFYDIVLVGGVEEMSKRTTEEVAEGLALATVPYEGEVGFTFPGCVRCVGNRVLCKIRSRPRGFDEHHTQEPQQCPVESQSPIPHDDSGYHGSPQKKS